MQSPRLPAWRCAVRPTGIAGGCVTRDCGACPFGGPLRRSPWRVIIASGRPRCGQRCRHCNALSNNPACSSSGRYSSWASCPSCHPRCTDRHQDIHTALRCITLRNIALCNVTLRDTTHGIARYVPALCYLNSTALHNITPHHNIHMPIITWPYYTTTCDTPTDLIESHHVITHTTPSPHLNSPRTTSNHPKPYPTLYRTKLHGMTLHYTTCCFPCSCHNCPRSRVL